AIDFPEEDLPPGLWEQARAEARALAAEIGARLADGGRGERLRDGVAVAILGPPNAGKSSLMNALARREVAITAATAGTTRDVIEVALDVAGYPVLLCDTAGLRAAADAVEEEGVRRARARAASADLKLVLYDATRPEERAALAGLLDADAILIANKTDLLPAGAPAPEGLPLSVATGAGMAALVARLGAAVAARLGAGDALVTRARHRAALEACRAALVRAAAADPRAPELAAEDLRAAARALGRITGRVDVEDMLDRLFAEFCIGK
ncbi:MAG TPA: GTPase, partial [Stellaceae bacterium]|nr:GTPase [Stellaceae bacterium]